MTQDCRNSVESGTTDEYGLSSLGFLIRKVDRKKRVLLKESRYEMSLITLSVN